MSYRDETNEVLEAPCAEGTLRADVGPRTVMLRVGRRTLRVVDGLVTVIEHGKKKDRETTVRIDGRLVVARDVPRDDLGIWLELDPSDEERSGWRRIFGVEPISTLEPNGLAALAILDRFAQRVRVELLPYARDIVRATEIGRGLDKVLLCDFGDRYVLFARRLFRDRARTAMAVHGDGRIVFPDGKIREVTVRSRHGVDVIGDYVRFSAPDGQDLAKVSIPWIAPEDRRELARRIGQLVDPNALARVRS